MKKSILAGVAFLFMAVSGRVAAYQVLLPINSSTSTLQTQMKMTLSSTSTSSDTVPASGFLLLDLNTNGVPTQISFRNFDIHTTRGFHFTNTLLYFFKLYTTVSNVQVFDGAPGPQEPYFPVTNGNYLATNIMFLLKGTAAYTGIASGSNSLNSSTPQSLSGTSGTWQVLNGTNRVHLDLTFAFAEITVTNSLGNVKVDISGAGSLNAQAPVNAPPPPAPKLAGGRVAGQFVIRWPSSLWPTPAATNTPAGYWLYRTTNLSPSSWEREPATVSDDGTWSTVDVPINATQRFYRLDWK